MLSLGPCGLVPSSVRTLFRPRQAKAFTEKGGNPALRIVIDSQSSEDEDECKQGTDYHEKEHEVPELPSEIFCAEEPIVSLYVIRFQPFYISQPYHPYQGGACSQYEHREEYEGHVIGLDIDHEIPVKQQTEEYKEQREDVDEVNLGIILLIESVDKALCFLFCH